MMDEQQGEMQGQDAMKEIGVGIMQQADALGKMAQIMGQTGNEAAAAKLSQAAELLAGVMSDLGMQGGDQGGGRQAAMSATPDTAGRQAVPAE